MQLSYSKKHHSSYILRNTSKQYNILDHISTNSAAKAVHFSHDVKWTAIRSPYYAFQHVIYEGSWRVRFSVWWHPNSRGVKMELLPKLAKGFKPWPTSLKSFIQDVSYGFERVSE